jgi:hypothetical protein
MHDYMKKRILTPSSDDPQGALTPEIEMQLKGMLSPEFCVETERRAAGLASPSVQKELEKVRRENQPSPDADG